MAFLLKYGGHIAIIIGVVVLFFGARWYVLDRIEKHDAAIVKETEDRKDAEWTKEINDAKIKMMESIENARKKNRVIERYKPRNKSDVVKCLRNHCIGRQA